MNKKKAVLLLHEQQEKGLSYRTLARRYGMSVSSVHKMVKQAKANSQAAMADKQQAADLPDDAEALKEELRKARLKIELQDLMIDIASKELGVDIRKKSGTRRS